jgi:HEAT repeat protein
MHPPRGSGILLAALALSASAAQGSDSAPEASALRARKILDAALSDRALGPQALVALGASHRNDASEKLSAALESKDVKTRAAAAQGLGLLGQPSACGNVLRRWSDEKSWEVKQELASAASDCGDPRVLSDLRTALDHKSRLVRVAAACALAHLGEHDGELALAKLGIRNTQNPSADWKDSWRSYQVLSGQKKGDRKGAVRNLAQFGGAENSTLFENALEDPDPLIRLWAAAGLCHLKG